jgi:hypothetical protein
MKVDKHFLLPVDPSEEPTPDEWAVIGLPPDATVPLATWSGLSPTSRTAYYAAEILAAAADLHAMLATDAGAHLRWMAPELERTSEGVCRLLERLAC